MRSMDRQSQKQNAICYAADGSRLKKVENAVSASEAVTIYINGAQLRRAPSGEKTIVTHLNTEARLTMPSTTNGVTTRKDLLYLEQL